MRAPAVLLALLALGGCTPTDPDLAKPCGQRRPASVVVGTGQYQFEIIGNTVDHLDGGGVAPVPGEGLPIETDPTYDTSLMWIGIACQGLGPNVRVNYGITDTLTDAGVSAPVPQLEQGQSLTYDPNLDRDEAPGLNAYFQLDAGSPFTNEAQLVGRLLTFWADVHDDCSMTPVHAEKLTSISGFDPASCTGCIRNACSTQLAACGPECVAIQACLDARCVNLSTIASVDETACQAGCEELHPTGRSAIIALANCVETSVCQPPCLSYSADYVHCVHGQDKPAGACVDANNACIASAPCQAYQTCVNACTSLAACQACATVPGGAAGQALMEAYELCIETTCITQGWIAHLYVSNP